MAFPKVKLSSYLPIVAGVVLVFGVGLTVVVLQQQQETRSRAASNINKFCTITKIEGVFEGKCLTYNNCRQIISEDPQYKSFLAPVLCAGDINLVCCAKPVSAPPPPPPQQPEDDTDQPPPGTSLDRRYVCGTNNKLPTYKEECMNGNCRPGYFSVSENSSCLNSGPNYICCGPIVGRPCKANGHSGTYQDRNVTQCSLGYYNSTVHFPGKPNIQCCVTSPVKCKSGTGTCRNSPPSKQAYSCPGGKYYSGFCPGPADVKCCVKSSPPQEPPQEPPPPAKSTKFAFTSIFLHGIGKAGDSVKPGAAGGGNPDPEHETRKITIDGMGIVKIRRPLDRIFFLKFITRNGYCTIFDLNCQVEEGLNAVVFQEAQHMQGRDNQPLLLYI